MVKLTVISFHLLPSGLINPKWYVVEVLSLHLLPKLTIC